jgi:amino acid permease
MTNCKVTQVYAILQQKDNETNHRYAADMRVITAITLVFLPGTFVATLFSASFWNFDPRTTGPMVSGWVWLYFFITLALMLIVLGVWRGYTIIKQSVSTVKEIWHTKRVRRWRGDESEVDDEEGGKKAA